MSEFYAFALSLALIFGAVMIHHQVLRLLSVGQVSPRLSRQLKILLVIFGLIVAHILEAGLFAGGYWVGDSLLNLGAFVGLPGISPSQLFFFSLETFTTVGVGDVYPVGALRMIASLEPLAGTILVGWSCSFTFLAMSVDWRLEKKTKQSSDRQPPRPRPSTPRS